MAAAKNRASVKGGISGLFEDEGKVQTGFKPWPKGQYAFQVTDADDSKPTRNGDYMLTLRLQCIGKPDDVDFEGRDPIGKTFWSRYVVQSESEHFEKQRTRLRNVCNAFGVKISKETNYFVGGARSFIGRKAACKLGIGPDRDGKMEQKWYEWVSIADSDYGDAEE